MRLRKSVLGAISGVAMITTMLLGGCGGGQQDDIVVWNPFTGADSANWQAMVDAFNETDPEIPIRNVSMEQDVMYTNISTAYPTGTGIPDLMVVHAERIAQFDQSGMLRQMDDLLTDFPEINGGNYVESAWDIGDINGHRYSVPLDVHSWVTYVNLDLLEQYGPGTLDDGVITFDEMREISERARPDGIATLGLTWGVVNFLATFQQLGGEITANGIDPTIDNQYGLAALNLWKEMYDLGVSNENGENPTQMWQTGQLIFLPEGIWFQNTANDIEDFNWEMVHSPQVDPNHIVNWTSSHQFVLFNNPERTPEKEHVIMEFIDFVRQNSLEWARAGQNPAALAILDDPEFANMRQSFLMYGDNQDTLHIFEYLYNGFLTSNIERVFFDGVFGNVTPEDALADAQRTTEDQIAQDRAAGGN